MNGIELVEKFFQEYAGTISYDGQWYTVSAYRGYGDEIEVNASELSEAIVAFYEAIEKEATE